MLIDSHCHLNHERLRPLGGPAAMVANAGAAGVAGMVTICCRIAQEMDTLLEIANSYDNVWCTIGTHPHDAGVEAEQAIGLKRLVSLAQSDPKIIGIGETGLDYFYNNSEPEAQQASFRKHIQACLETGLPLVVHARDADDDIMRIIREEGEGTALKGVMHSFSSSRAMGEAALDFGFYISLSGMVTFKKSSDLQDFARMVPLDRLLVETDAPYLAPEPDRSKNNEPARVVDTARYIAQLKSVSEENIANHTTKNFFCLFDRAKIAC